MSLDADLAHRILDRTRSMTDDWVSFLEELARLESPSTEPETQRPVQRMLTAALEEVGVAVRHHPGETSGGYLVGEPVGITGDRPSQLLLGHTDTVWPVGTLATMPVERDAGILRGPGVFDMKGGLTHIIIALRVLRELSLEPTIPPLLLFNSDEEIGSDESTEAIERMAARSCRVFVLEPALDPDGKVKTTRKGIGSFSVRIRGRSAHAGLDPERGASAIQELSFVIQELHAMSDPTRGIHVNVGEIRGGSRSNVIAAEAAAEVDLRMVTMEEGERVVERIRAIRARVPGCSVEITGGVDRGPLEATPGNRLLWRAAKELGDAMGLGLGEGAAGGASDGNITSLTTPTLDGLGPVGDGAHAAHEHVNIERSVERCALLGALLLLPEDPAA